MRVPSPENLICRTLIFFEQACQRGHATTHMPKSKRPSHRPPCTGILNSNHRFGICLVYAKVASGGPRNADAALRWEVAGGIIETAKGNLSWHWYYPKNYPGTKSPKPSATPARSKTNIPKYHYPKRPRSMWVVNSARLMRSRCGAQHYSVNEKIRLPSFAWRPVGEKAQNLLGTFPYSKKLVAGRWFKITAVIERARLMLLQQIHSTPNCKS